MNYGNTESVVILLIIIFAVILLIAFVKNTRGRKSTDALELTIRDAGYAYDKRQDIFFSRSDAWQKHFGYSRLYDEAAAPMSMIIDCEPVRFHYAGKEWLIEFWKGQYGMTTGCEIGIYNREESSITPYSSGVEAEPFYKCASDEDQLHLAFALKKNGETLFAREGKHWWLTGFRLGEFSEPFELTMDVRVTFKDREMCDAFVFALEEMGYSSNEMRVIGLTVWIDYEMPLSLQPLSRTTLLESLTQKKNRLLCEQFHELTREYRTAPEKIRALREKAPELYRLATSLGRTMQLFDGAGISTSRLSRG